MTSGRRDRLPAPPVAGSTGSSTAAAFSITNAKLLEGIRETGSISAAARRVGMPYKKAWMLLDGMNQAFTEPVITAAPGGAGGGGASLTPFGTELLDRYQRLAKRAAALAADDITALVGRVRLRRS